VLLFEFGRHGFEDIVLLDSFCSDQVRAYATDHSLARRFGFSLRVVVEPEQAGTGGAVAHVLGEAQETFLRDGSSS
jgi:NDP-sugar pyrophosphorylase family protein